MELTSSLYCINVIMCFTSCVGQLLHADVLTEFFSGNSRHNVEHNENQVFKTYSQHQNLLPPVLDDYIDMFLHKSHHQNVADSKIRPRNTISNVHSRNERMLRERDLHLGIKGELERLRTLMLNNESSGGERRPTLLDKQRQHQLHTTDLQRQTLINLTAQSKPKVKTTGLSREQEVLLSILKRKGINIDLTGKVTSTARPYLKAKTFKKLTMQKAVELPLVKNVKQLSEKVSKDETATTTKPTSQVIIPDKTQYMYLENPSKNNANITKSITQHKTTSTLRQAEIDTTEQTSQKLSSTTPSLALTNIQQIPHVSSRNLTKQTKEVIQPPKQFQTSTPSMLTIQNEIWMETSSQQTPNTLPLTSIFQIAESSAPLTLSTSASSSSSSSSSTTTSTTTTAAAADIRIMNGVLWSTPPSKLIHSSYATKITASIPIHQKQIQLPVTQRTNDLEIKNNSNVNSVYQTIDEKSKLNNSSGDKVLAAKDVDLFFEKLKNSNFFNNLNKNGKDKKAKSRTDCAKECTILQNVCKNGGTCVNSCQGFSCICAEGFTGYFCEKIVKTI